MYVHLDATGSTVTAVHIQAQRDLSIGEFAWSVSLPEVS